MALLLGASFFFSSSETALFSLSRIERRRLSARDSRIARLILTLLKDPKDLLSTVLFGNMIVNVLFYSLTYGFAHRFVTPVTAALVSAMGLLIVIIFGEVIPKSVAISMPRRLSMLFALPLTVFQKVTRPVRVPLGIIITFLTKSVLPHRRHKFITADELRMLIDLSEKEGIIDPAERTMIREVFELREVPVREVMIPRVDMAVFRLPGTREDLLNLVRRTRNSKIPVCERSIDNIKGVVYAKDLFLNPDEDITQFIRPVLFVAESMTIEDLLRQFREQKAQFAIVVDEFGGTDGLITLEDVLEEIVGEIQDEFDSRLEPVVRDEDGSYLVAGDLSIREWSELFSMNINPARCMTVGGLVTWLLGHLPKQGETVRYRNLLFTVEEMRKHRLARVRLTLEATQAHSSGGRAQS